jgi:hypothetical protein
MSEEESSNKRQRKRTGAGKRFVAPDNIPEGQAWVGAPPPMQADEKQAKPPQRIEPIQVQPATVSGQPTQAPDPPKLQNTPALSPSHNPLKTQKVPPDQNPFLEGDLLPGQQALRPGDDPHAYGSAAAGRRQPAANPQSTPEREGQAGGQSAKNLPGSQKNSEIIRKSTSVKKTTGLARKARRITQNWYWPDVEGESKKSQVVPEIMVYSLTRPLGLLKGSDSQDGLKMRSQFAQAIQDYDLHSSKSSARPGEFAELRAQICNSQSGAASGSLDSLQKLADSLQARSAARELIELAPRVCHLLEKSRLPLQDLVEICRAAEAGQIAADSLAKMFEQLNRLFDAPVLPARRDLAVEHFLRATAAALSASSQDRTAPLNASEIFLLADHCDCASKLLLSIMTSTRANTEELAIRAFKFDPLRSSYAVRVMRAALEPEAGMKADDSAASGNYFSHLFSSVAINAVLQAENPRARYAVKQNQPVIYEVEEEEVKKGVFRVISSARQPFGGLSWDQIAWINFQFAGRHLSENTPARLIY